jgi:hypothetical protein
MPAHNFQPLYDIYPEIIARMESEFTSHEFILELAQQNQKEYVEALYAYRHHDPFRNVHGPLAKRLHQHKGLVEHIGDAPSSENIFRDGQRCARWRKL